MDWWLPTLPLSKQTTLAKNTHNANTTDNINHNTHNNKYPKNSFLDINIRH